MYALAIHEGWISPFAAKKLKERAPQDIAAGLYLESQGVMNFDQLRSLFFSEVVDPVVALCHIQTAYFNFQATTNLPMTQMTSFRIPAAQIYNRVVCSHNCEIGFCFYEQKPNLKVELLA